MDAAAEGCRVWTMEHILIDCGMTEDAVDKALTAVELIRGEEAEATKKPG